MDSPIESIEKLVGREISKECAQLTAGQSHRDEIRSNLDVVLKEYDESLKLEQEMRNEIEHSERRISKGNNLLQKLNKKQHDRMENHELKWQKYDKIAHNLKIYMEKIEVLGKKVTAISHDTVLPKVFDECLIQNNGHKILGRDLIENKLELYVKAPYFGLAKLPEITEEQVSAFMKDDNDIMKDYNDKKRDYSKEIHSHLKNGGKALLSNFRTTFLKELNKALEKSQDKPLTFIICYAQELQEYKKYLEELVFETDRCVKNGRVSLDEKCNEEDIERWKNLLGNYDAKQ